MSGPKDLILMRHAEAGRANHDHDRPLTEKGRAQATNMAARLTNLSDKIQTVLCSDALRTTMTWELMEGSIAKTAHIQLTPRLYLAGVGSLLGELMVLEETQQCVLLIGHNPGLENLIQFLTGEHMGLSEATVVRLKHAGGTWMDSAAEPHSWTIDEVFGPQP